MEWDGRRRKDEEEEEEENTICELGEASTAVMTTPTFSSALTVCTDVPVASRSKKRY